MKIVVARTSGFCRGVQLAVDRILERVASSSAPVRTLGPLVHNPQALAFLRDRGVEVVSHLAEAVEGTMAVRTHGIPPATRQALRARGLEIFDLTCPHVGRIQGLVRRIVRRGHHALIAGDAAHAEVVGLLGYAEGRGHVVAGPEEVAAVPLEVLRVGLVAQSTFDPEVYRRIAEAAQCRWPEAEVHDTLCDATAERQGELRAMAREADAVVVVGGRGSANTARLAALARSLGRRTFAIESEEELEPEAFRGVQVVAVTAGASTPRWQTDRVVARLAEIDAGPDGA